MPPSPVHPAPALHVDRTMKLTEALKNPVAVAVAVALICAFGLLSLLRMPLQLFPDIDRPQLGIFTGWRAASPQEIESELLEPLENVLQGLPGVITMEGNAQQGGAQVFLTFAVGTDMRAMLVDVLGRLNQLPPIPRDAVPPTVQLLGGDGTDLTWYFVQKLPGTAGVIEGQQRFIEDQLVPRIEAVPGVAAVEVNGVAGEELRIELDLQRAAALGVSIPQVGSRRSRRARPGAA
jgi:multidrug efflux pump subunit AcrB